MDGQEAFKRIQQQLRRAANQGGGGKVPGGGLFAGGGLIVALIAGGIALNASLFNGTGFSRFILSHPTFSLFYDAF
jgi:prohibitin 2